MTISATERLDIVKLVVGTFNAAPGEVYLNELVPIVDNGGSMLDVATALTQTDTYRSSAFYPVFLTSEEWANRFADNVLNNATLAASERQWAVDWIVGQLNAGATQAEIIVGAIGALDAIPHDDPVWGDAAAAFDNRAEVAEFYSVDAKGTATDVATLQGVIADVDSSQASVDEAIDNITNPPVSGTDFNLTVGSAAGADVMRLTGDMDVRIDVTKSDNQVTGLDLNGNGVIELNGIENNNPTTLDDGIDFAIVDAQSRNLLNQGDTSQNFLGDISFDGTGNGGDGVSTNGNIFLGGLGVDRASGGIGNDFMSGGGVRADRFEFRIADGGGFLIDTETGKAAGTTEDYLFGGRNADFFFASLSALDFTDGDTLDIDGGETADDTAAGQNESSMDSDWLLIEASDDDEPVEIFLAESGQQGWINTPFMQDLGGNIDTGDANDGIDIANLEHVDASGNLYGFLDDMDVAMGENGMMVDGENVGIGSSAQLVIWGNSANNILIGGYDNDYIDGGWGDDLLMGGNLRYALNNPNAAGIVNDGMDELYGYYGDDNIVFEADGGIIDGGEDDDTLWLTDQSLGTVSPDDADTVITDGVLRIELMNGDWDDDGNWWFAGTGGADVEGTADQTNYIDDDMRVEVDGMDSVIASGLGAIDYRAAGTNDPELLFRNQQNHFAYNGDLDLRGHGGDNVLYAGAGDDVIEGRWGDDLLSGGAGRDDFYFSLGVYGEDGDGVDVIHRQTDANGDNIWDGGFEQDFGIGRTVEEGTSFLNVDFTGSDLALPGVAVAIFNVTVDGVLFEGGDTDTLSAFTSVADLAEHLNEVFSAQDPTMSVTSDGEVVIVQKAGGGVFGTDIASGTVIAGTATNGPLETHITTDDVGATVTPDRLIYASYEDRSDNELVDDDAVTGSQITLGGNNYAQDLVVSFSEDGTRIAQGQYYDIYFDNLTTEDVVTLTVNGVTYSLQVGISVDGTQVDGEDSVFDDQDDVQGNFLSRFADFINSFMDDDTAAGNVGAWSWWNGITIYQNAYTDGEETVFMNAPTVALQNRSGGEAPSYEVENWSNHEVHLLDYDGRNNNAERLSEENVLFWGDTRVSQAVLATALVEGGELNGSDAVVINGGVDDLIDVPHNLATDDELETDTDDDGSINDENNGNFVVHGDDYLIGGVGDDVISAGTGDDRVRGSLGDDVVDGGKDLYAVRLVGSSKYVVETLNAYEAKERDADAEVLDIYLLEQTEWADEMIQGDDFVPYFQDTLVFHQADFTAGKTRFTIDLDNFAVGTNEILLEDGGAGTVSVDDDGDGDFEAETTFTNFEHIRTVSGVSKAVAGDGQGNDTLILTALSDAVADGKATAPATDTEGVVYYLVDGGNAGLVQAKFDITDNNSVDIIQDIIRVDGVENVISGKGDDDLYIDETEAAKNNRFEAGAGDDQVIYQNNFGNADVEPTVTINVGAAHAAGSNSSTDTVVMTKGRVGTVVATDTLVGVETISLQQNTAAGPRADDVLNVEALSGGATVDYTNGKVYSDTDGDFDPTDGVLQLTINGITQMEFVVADGSDTVVVADAAVMDDNSRFSNTDSPIQIETYISYDAIDVRGAAPVRLTLGDMRTIAAGTAKTADEGSIPQVQNFELFNFELGQGVDTVDYSNELADIAAVVNFDDADVQYVMVSGDTDDFYNDAEARIDRLVDVEQVVASRGESILDMTNSGQDLEIKFLNWEDSGEQRVASLDRDVYLIQLADLATLDPISRAYVEYRDTSLRDTALENNKVTQPTASWNRIEGGDFAEVVILNSVHSFDNDTFNLRGGDNQVKYNELTRSINATISVTEFDPAALAPDAVPVTPINTGLITAGITFQDGAGNPLPGGGKHQITSYTAGNAVAEGSLRIAASQDAEDSVTFTGATDKLFVLGVSGATDNLITVTVGEDDVNSIVLTGFEFLLDGSSNDAYDMRNLSNVTGNLTLVDSPNDHDAILVRNDAINFNASGLNTIDLDNLGATLGGFNFDFDVLDVTNVTNSGLILNGGTNAAPANVDGDLTDEVVLGLLSRVTAINDFESMVMTQASIAGGTNFVFNPATNTLQQGSTTVTTSADILSFGGLVFENTLRNSYVPDVTTGVTVNVAGGGAAQVHGGDGADTITGSGGNDVFQGNGGNDTLDGGLGVETRQIQLGGTLDGAAGGTVTLTFTGGGAYNVTVTEGTEVVVGAGSNAVGAALAAKVNANLAVLNATAAWNGGALMTGATFDAATQLMTFTFTPGIDVTGTIAGATTDGSATFFISAETTTQQGGDGGNDTFLFEPTAAENGADTINNFTGGDILNFQSYFAGTFLSATFWYDFGANVPEFGGTGFGGNYVVIGFNKATLSASDFAGANANNNNMKSVYITTADTDLVPDATNDPWNVYYAFDSDPTAGVNITVALVGTVNTPTEFPLAGANVVG